MKRRPIRRPRLYKVLTSTTRTSARLRTEDASEAIERRGNGGFCGHCFGFGGPVRWGNGDRRSECDLTFLPSSGRCLTEGIGVVEHVPAR